MKYGLLVLSLLVVNVGCGGGSVTPDESAGVQAETAEVEAAPKPVEEAKPEAAAASVQTPGLMESNPAAQAPADVAAPPAGATQTVTGLAFVVLRAPEEGARRANRESTVTAHYSGWTTDGKTFDSSVTRGEPATFPLNRVIAGWTEGVGSMSEGEIRRFWIPENLAYKGRAGSPAGMLVFDVELVRIDD